MYVVIVVNVVFRINSSRVLSVWKLNGFIWVFVIGVRILFVVFVLFRVSEVVLNFSKLWKWVVVRFRVIRVIEVVMIRIVFIVM